MSEFKRRDLLNYFNNKHIEEQKKLYNNVGFSDCFKNDFFDFVISNNMLNKSINELESEIDKNSAKILNINQQNILVRPNIYNAIELIFNATLDLYESVCATDNSIDFYEKSVFVNKGKFTIISMDFTESEVQNVINTIRSKNTKVFILCTKKINEEDKVSIDIVEKIVRECSALVVIDDFYSEFKDDSYLALANKYDNVILIKSFYKLDEVKNNTSVFIVSNRNIIDNLKNFTNYCDIDMFAKINLLFSFNCILHYNSESIQKNIKASQIVTDKKDEISNNVPIDFDDISMQDEVLKNVNEQIKEQQEISFVVDNEELNQSEEELKVKVDINISDVVIDDGKYNIESYEPNLSNGDRQSLIDEVTKFGFISIFSSNPTHVYILSKTPIYMNLVDNNIILKKYHSSNGEIIRLNIDSTKQNIKVLKVLNEINQTRKIYDVFGE